LKRGGQQKNRDRRGGCERGIKTKQKITEKKKDAKKGS